MKCKSLSFMVVAALAAGCTTMGTGTGSTLSGANPVTFSWKSSDGVSGTMSATLSDGQTYSGQYFEITKDTTTDSVGPLWYGWGPGWGYGGGGTTGARFRRRTSSRTTRGVWWPISARRAAPTCGADLCWCTPTTA